MSAYEAFLTVGEVRQLLWRSAITDPTDPEGVFLNMLNQALEQITTRGVWEGTKQRIDDLTPYIVDGVLTLPYAQKTLLGMQINGSPLGVVAQDIEFSRSGPGHRDAGDGGGEVIDLGFSTVGARRVRSYKILPSLGATDEVAGLCLNRFVPLYTDEDLVAPSNVIALKYALMAVGFEDEADLERSEAFWTKCIDTLSSEKEQTNTGMRVPVSFNPYGEGASGVSTMY